MSTLRLPRGFLWTSGTAGLKASGNPDLALALVPGGATAAAMFTTNRVAAAPVVLGREHLTGSRGRVRALVVNAGNANCATGPQGLKAAREVCKAVAQLCGVDAQLVFPSSTGIIGVPLRHELILGSLPAALAGAASNEGAVAGFAHAIMTTDTRPKLASAEFTIRGKQVRVLGVAKGAGMIHPNMATMLAYLFTDADASPATLRTLLRAAVGPSLNSISIDGDTSTNDTVLLLASGKSGVKLTGAASAPLRIALGSVCASLAEQIVADGEGVRHVVELLIEGASSDQGAQQIARTLATSLLTKTAWAGSDPNWGRILAAVGRSGVRVDPRAVAIWIGALQVCAKGIASGANIDQAAQEMQKPRYSIRVRVGGGLGRARYLSCDLTEQYVRINADYST